MANGNIVDISFIITTTLVKFNQQKLSYSISLAWMHMLVAQLISQLGWLKNAILMCMDSIIKILEDPLATNGVTWPLLIKLSNRPKILFNIL